MKSFPPPGFEWDAFKAESNWEKHEIDFQDAIAIFDSLRFEKLSPRHGEPRYLAVGCIHDLEVVVVWTPRGPDGEVRRIISARPAKGFERDAYRQFINEQAGAHRLGEAES